MFFNVDVEPISTIAGLEVEQTLNVFKEQSFKYLGSWTEKERDVQTRQAQAWKVLEKLVSYQEVGISKSSRQLLRRTSCMAELLDR